MYRGRSGATSPSRGWKYSFSTSPNFREEKEYEEIARIIISGYGDFKLTEFMVFFQRFKQGLYGTFYGVFDPMVITRSLREFRADREKLLRFYEDKKRQEEKEREWELREKEKATPGQIKEIIDKYSKKES